MGNHSKRRTQGRHRKPAATRIVPREGSLGVKIAAIGLTAAAGGSLGAGQAFALSGPSSGSESSVVQPSGTGPKFTAQAWLSDSANWQHLTEGAGQADYVKWLKNQGYAVDTKNGLHISYSGQKYPYNLEQLEALQLRFLAKEHAQWLQGSM